MGGGVSSDSSDIAEVGTTSLALSRIRVWYLGEAPVLAAPDQPGDDLGHAALLALVGVGHQPLHVRPQQGEEGVVEVAKQSLMERIALVKPLVPPGLRHSNLEELSP